MEYPNHIFVCEYKGPNDYDGESHFVIVVVADTRDTAKNYVKSKIGIDVEPTWLMGSVYHTILTSNGASPEKIQAKILYNGNFHTYLHP